MAGFIQNILWNSVEGFVEAGTRSAGEYAGNALIKAGDMIENSGRGVGNSIEKKATNYGSSLSGQTYKPSPKALPSTARKPVVKRSNSLPASSRLVKGGTKGVNSTPQTGGKTYPGTNPVHGSASKKTGVAGSVGRAKSTTSSSVTNGANVVVGNGRKGFNGVTTSTSSARQKSPGLPSTLPSRPSYPPVTPVPKPSKPSLPSTGGLKTAVRPGAPKPFVLPTEQHNKGTDSTPKSTPKPYPGTNTLPGQASKTPVSAQKTSKPLPRLGPQVGPGQKMQHIAF